MRCIEVRTLFPREGPIFDDEEEVTRIVKYRCESWYMVGGICLTFFFIARKKNFFIEPFSFF